MTEPQMRVVIVENHEVVRAGLLAILRRDPALDVVGSFRSAEEAIEQIDSLEPDVVVLDHRLPGMNGAAACREITARRPALPVAILSTSVDDSVIHACLAAGARAYLLKDANGDDLIHAVKAVARGECVLAPAVVGRVVEWARTARSIHQRGEALAPHELAALSLAAQGMTNRELARRLHVSEASAKLYMRSAMRKLGVRERAQAVAAGIRRGVI